MVLIGETGTGKTSFIEFLLNYAEQFETLENFDLTKVTSFVKKEEVGAKDVWESDTRYSKKYAVDFGDFRLDIIDTPGFNDTKNTEDNDQEKKNIANIIGKVKQELYVNCVCLVFNGSEVRLTPGMTKVIKEIVSILPPGVLRNIIILFTKTWDTLSLKFDIRVLKKFVPEDHTFVIDNPYSRLESAEKTDKKKMKTLKRDFEDSHETLEEMFMVIKKLKPEVTLNFGLFFEIVQQIECCFAKIRSCCHNKSEIRNVLAVMESEKPKYQRITYDTIEVISSDQRNLICNATGCNSNCHMTCGCWFTFFTLRACSSIRGGICTTCSHHYSDHSLNYYSYKKEKNELLLPDLRSVEKKQYLREALANCKSKIEEEVYHFEEKLKKFQSLGSNSFFSQKGITEIERMKKQVENIPTFEFNDKLNSILDATLEVLQNPLASTPHDDIKVCWACATLGLYDTDNITEEDIAKFYKRQAQKFHPDRSGDVFTTSWFQKINHAKEYLKKKFSRK